MASIDRGPVVLILMASGALLFLAGVGVIAFGRGTLLGAALMVVGVGDFVAAFVLRSRHG